MGLAIKILLFGNPEAKIACSVSCFQWHHYDITKCRKNNRFSSSRTKLSRSIKHTLKRIYCFSWLHLQSTLTGNPRERCIIFPLMEYSGTKMENKSSLNVLALCSINQTHLFKWASWFKSSRATASSLVPPVRAVVALQRSCDISQLANNILFSRRLWLFGRTNPWLCLYCHFCSRLSHSKAEFFCSNKRTCSP